MWCVWWTGEPTAKPFRRPDAWGGGATTEEEARALAEKAAGRPLVLIDGHWAGAWKRVLADRPPFPTKSTREPTPQDTADATERAAKKRRVVDPYDLLGVPASATMEEVKAAFRKKALEHHPDHGGSAAAFMAMKRAYDSISKRRPRPRRP